MSKNDDALRCAESLCVMGFDAYAAHIRRLVAENEAQAALLRQAVEAMKLVTGHERLYLAERAIRQHLEGK